MQQSLTPRHVLGHREQHTCRRMRGFPKAACVLLTPVVAKADKTAFHFYTATRNSCLHPPSPPQRSKAAAPVREHPGPPPRPARANREPPFPGPGPAPPRAEAATFHSSALALLMAQKHGRGSANYSRRFLPSSTKPAPQPAERPRPSPGRFSPSSPEDLRAPSPPRETAGPSCGRRSGPVPALTCRASRAAASATRASILPLRERAEAEVATPERKRKRRNEGQRPRAEGRAPRVRAAAGQG